MTAPQTTLYRLESRVSYLCNLLEANEDHESISERMRRVEADIGDLMASQQRIENMLKGIVELLDHKG